MQERFDSNAKEMADLEAGGVETRAGKQAERIDELKAEKDERAKELEDMKKRKDSLASNPYAASSPDDMKKLDDAIKEKESQVKAADDKLNNQEKYNKLSAQQSQLKDGINDCTKREETFANIDKSAGMDGRTYSSAKDFETKKAMDKNMRALNQYKGLDNEAYAKTLTPKDRANLAQQKYEAAAKERSIERRRAVGRVAMGAAGAVAMGALAAYSGPTETMAAAGLGAKGGGAVGKVAATPVHSAKNGVTAVRGAVSDFGVEVRSAKQNIQNASGKIKQGAQERIRGHRSTTSAPSQPTGSGRQGKQRVSGNFDNGRSKDI